MIGALARRRLAAAALAVLASGAQAAATPDRGAAALPPPPPAWSPSTPPPPLATPPPRAGTVAPLDELLANGLRVVVVEEHRRPVVTIRLVLPAGAVTDPPRVAGATWLAVHLVSDFHERSERGETLAGEKSLRRQFGELGAAMWVDVEPDCAILGVSGYARDAAIYLGLLADAVVTPRHGAESFAARRNALLDAIEDVESSDPEALERVVVEAAFGPGHPYARSTIGTLESHGPLGLEDVVAQQELVLAPGGATLVVVGDVAPQAVLAAARKVFAPWRRPAPRLPRVAQPAIPGGPAEVKFLRRQPARTLVVCAARPLPDVQGSDAALSVLAAILGGGTRSRLALALREESALTYDARAEIVRRKAARALVACSALEARRAEEGIRLFRATLESLRERPPTSAELARAKGVRAGELEAAQDDARRAADAWVTAIALGERYPRPGQERAELERVTAADVQRLARGVLRAGTLRWIVSGDPGVAARAAAANGMGRLVTLTPGQ